MKHFHVYDVCGVVMCVDADDWEFTKTDSCAWFYKDMHLDNPAVVATFNWSNVVCVREEADDDDDKAETPLPEWVPDVVLS